MRRKFLILLWYCLVLNRVSLVTTILNVCQQYCPTQKMMNCKQLRRSLNFLRRDGANELCVNHEFLPPSDAMHQLLTRKLTLCIYSMVLNFTTIADTQSAHRLKIRTYEREILINRCELFILSKSQIHNTKLMTRNMLAQTT